MINHWNHILWSLFQLAANYEKQLAEEKNEALRRAQKGGRILTEKEAAQLKSASSSTLQETNQVIDQLQSLLKSWGIFKIPFFLLYFVASTFKRKAADEPEVPNAKRTVEVQPRMSLQDVSFVLDSSKLYVRSSLHLRSRALEGLKDSN